MGFFDRFKKRIKEVADDTDIESITAEEDSEEAQAALAKKEAAESQRDKEIELQIENTPDEGDWEDIEDIDSVIVNDGGEDDWDDLDDEPIPQPLPSTLDKKERKKLQQKEKLAKKEEEKTQKNGFRCQSRNTPRWFTS